MTIHTALVVDDSPSARLILSKQLAALGYEVEQAVSGEEALACLEAFRPDVVFMDHSLRGLGGFETTLEIASASATADIPVILMTTRLTEAFRLRARAHGAVTAMAKDARVEGLVQVLESLRAGQRESRHEDRMKTSVADNMAAFTQGRPTAVVNDDKSVRDRLQRETRAHFEQAVTSAWVDAEQDIMQAIPQLVQRLRPAVEAALQEMADDVIATTLEDHLRHRMAGYASDLADTLTGTVTRTQRHPDPVGRGDVLNKATLSRSS